MVPQKIRHIATSPIFWFFFVLGGGLLLLLVLCFTNLELIRNNLGEYTLWLELVISGLTILLGGLFFGLSAYKIGYFSHIPHSRKSGFFGAVGSFLSVVVTGCPACSITIASYLGLSSLFAGLPFLGYEVRIVGLLIMVFAIVQLWKNLETCQMGKKPPRA